jgi:hypothetical protein
MGAEVDFKMRKQTPIMRVTAGLCIMLAGSTCLPEVCLAGVPPAEAPTDSLVVFMVPDEVSFEDLQQEEPPLGITEDEEDAGRPVYRRWWFWAIGIGTLIAVAVASGGDEGGEEPAENLPDFPEPPER